MIYAFRANLKKKKILLIKKVNRATISKGTDEASRSVSTKRPELYVCVCERKMLKGKAR